MCCLHDCVLSCVLLCVLQIDIFLDTAFSFCDCVLCYSSHWTLPVAVLCYYHCVSLLFWLLYYFMLWVRGFGSLCLFNFSSDLFVLFIDIFSTCCRFAYCRTFICTDIHFELVSAVFFLVDIFFWTNCHFSMLSYIYFNKHSFSFIVIFVLSAGVHCGRALFYSASFRIYFFLSCVGRSGRTGEPGKVL